MRVVRKTVWRLVSHCLNGSIFDYNFFLVMMLIIIFSCEFQVGNDGGREDEKRLTEFARRTLEVFILDHILCNKVEGAYKEAIALKMQEELIREEEENLNKRRVKSTK